MPDLDDNLELDRCPHCSVAKPLLAGKVACTSWDHLGVRGRSWRVYTCSVCGGAVLGGSDRDFGMPVTECYPEVKGVSEEIPEAARRFLKQAIETQFSPDASIMTCASAVDAMLQAKGLVDGTLNERINRAAGDHLITPEMAQWAHQIRLDANDRRHANASTKPPTGDDARRCVDFAVALGDFLFVLPSRVTRGLNDQGIPRPPAASA